MVVLFSRRRRRGGRSPDLAWVTSHLPINLAVLLSEVIIRNVLRAAAAGGDMHGRSSDPRGKEGIQGKTGESQQ